MEKHKKYSPLAILVLIIGIFLTLYVGMAQGSISSSLEVEDSKSNTTVQMEEKECKDAEEVGTGKLIDLICVKDGEAYCQETKYEPPANTGTCTPDEVIDGI